MKKMKLVTLDVLLFFFLSSPTLAWHDETHLAVARAAGYSKWYNSAGADIAKLKAGKIEQRNHYSNNPPELVISIDMVLAQASRYNDPDDETGHLYGAIISSVRDYKKVRETGKYGEYHLAYCVHYIGDLSNPLHNTLYNDFNRTNHSTIDGTVENEVLENYSKIAIYPISVDNEKNLAAQIARIANLSKNLGYRLEAERRLLTKEEAYRQLSHSASLIKAVLNHLGGSN
jgi:hypothetical protein